MLQANSDSTPTEQESIEPELIDRETIEQMNDEPRDGREGTRYLAIARKREGTTTYVLFARTDGTHGFERGYPLGLAWEAIPRSVVVETGAPERFPDTAQNVVINVLELYEGVSVDEDRSVDWRVDSVEETD